MSQRLQTCLFIDDEPGVLKALKRALRSEPCHFRFAESGRQGLRMLAQEPADIVVTDMHMPGMTGLEFLARVAEQYPHSIRLVLSGGTGTQDILNAVNNGRIYRYILKPWNDLELKSILHQALEISRLQQEKRQLLSRLQQHNRELEKRVAEGTAQLLKIRNQAEIGKYASQIVHDLNNPLHAITSVIDFLRTDLSNDKPMNTDEVSTWLDLARKATEDLTTIISGILLHVRDQSLCENVEVDINALIEQELKFFKLDRQFLEDVNRKTALTADLPKVTGQPVQLKQVIDNLIRNAWDAMAESTEKKLFIETIATNGWVELRISDTGEGIDTEHLDRIFDPDFSTKPVCQGTGLGLASVKTMIESYGGTIGVTSTRGQGTQFTVKLPPDHQQTTTPQPTHLKKTPLAT